MKIENNVNENSTITENDDEIVSTDIDSPFNLNFEEPNELATQSVDDEQGTGAEAQEDDNSPKEGEEGKVETKPAEGNEDPNVEAIPEPVEAVLSNFVKMADGTQSSIKELMDGNLRQQDYSRKTAVLADDRKAVMAHAQSMQNTASRLAEFVMAQIPPEPDQSMAASNPQAYIQMKAQHDAVASQFEQILALASEPQQVVEGMGNIENNLVATDENEKLAIAFPETVTEEGRGKFFEMTDKVGKAVGYSAEEMDGVIDHRLLVLAHWADKGMKADEALKKATTKVADVPPVLGSKSSSKSVKPNNAAAMKRLNNSGSMADAMSVDFN